MLALLARIIEERVSLSPITGFVKNLGTMVLAGLYLIAPSALFGPVLVVALDVFSNSS